jgi:hypothetical protein
MRAVADISRQELEQTLTVEIAKARSEARPISRMTLSRVLQSKYSINPQNAEKFVDTFCDDKAPGVPTYLSSEFGIPYLKVLAIVNVTIALGLAITTAVTMSRGGYGFLVWLILAILFLGSAALCWLQSIRPEKVKDSARMTTELPNISAPTEHIETVSTGS